MTDLLQEAMNARQNGDNKLAKQLISQALVQEPGNEAAWMMMSEVVDDVRLRRNCLERALAINPNNTAASTALVKLDTSPLSPVTRGERDKPINPPVYEKVPPFTPPFTWEGDPQQYPVVGEPTYPELNGEPQTAPADYVPTFDWANESEEPDKTIDKLFDAVSNPDIASQPLSDTELNLLEQHYPDDLADVATDSVQEKEDVWLDELVGSDDETLSAPLTTNKEDFTVSAEPQLGLEAFTSPEQSLEAVTPDYRLWDNPKAKTDRMVILSNKSLLHASPKASDVPHIIGLFAENKMLRDLLGENAGMIKLESIQRVTAEPKKANLSIDYKSAGEKPTSLKLAFSSSEVRDEAVEGLKIRIGPDFVETARTFTMEDKIIPPVVTLLFIAFIGWGLLAGLPLLSSLSGGQLGFLQTIVQGLQNFVASIGTTVIFLIALICGILAVVWLVINLRKPSKLIILAR